MSGSGEKRELKKLMSNLHEMLRFLGENDGSSFTIKIDEFEHLRRDFIRAAEEYEKDSIALANTSIHRDRQLLIAKISMNKGVMDKSLKQMLNECLRMDQKIKSGKNKKRKVQEEKDQFEKDLEYKNLVIYQLQNIYFKLIKKEHKSVAVNENYPEQTTLEELRLKQPLRKGFSEVTDPESEEYLKEKEILEAIKHIDNNIEEKMDFILDGLRMVHYNAVGISKTIDDVHKKVIINIDRLDENMENIEEAEKLLEEASPLVSKPNCIMNVIIIVLMGILIYFIVRKVMGDSSSNTV